MVESLAPFFPSSLEVVKRMLALSRTGKNDVVLDLGCGDGRILFAAVREFGAKKAIGYEMRPELLNEVYNQVMSMGLEDKITLYNEDLMKANLCEATVITIYLTDDGNEKLKPKIIKEAGKWTKIVSHDFTFKDWKPSAIDEIEDHTIYMYIMPTS